MVPMVCIERPASETKPRDIRDAERRALAFGDHVRVEKLQFGRRLSAQLWVRRP